MVATVQLPPIKQLAQFYRYVFYWGYEWSLRKYGARDAPAITGLLILSFCFLLNVATAALAVLWLLNSRVVLYDAPQWLTALAALLLLLPHYWILVRDGHYLTIAAEFDAWGADRRWYMNRRVIFYILGSFLALVAAAYCGKHYHNPLRLPW